MTARRRVMLLSYCLDLGGSERQLTEVAKALDPERYEVHAGCLRTGGLREAELRAAGLPIVAFPMNSFFSAAAVRQAMRLRRYIREHRIDLVHSFDVPMNVFGVPAAKLAGRAIVLSSQRAHRSLTSGARLRVLRWTDRMVDGVVVNCEFIRRHLMDDEHIPAERIHLCYNGLDLDAFPFQPRTPGEEVTIGIVCALRPEKNIPLLVRAFAQVRETRASRLLIVGSGPEQHVIETLVRELGMGESVEIIPATRDVSRWLHRMDTFVLPSTTEALSNALIEAMASGCAVIASDVGGNPELTGRDGGRGLLFRSNDADDLSRALRVYLDDAGRRARDGQAARAFVEERLTIAASIRRMTGIYESFWNRSTSSETLRRRS